MEIEKYGLREASLRVPLSRLEPAMQTGRASFSWTEIARWFQPSFPAGVAVDPTAWLDLPLNVVTPLFMQCAQRKQRKKNVPAQNIPDLFSGSAPATPAAADPAAPSSSPSLAMGHSMPAHLANLLPKPVTYSPLIKSSAEPPLDALVEIMNSLTRPDWSPSDTVKKMSAFPGIGGVMLATKDGLVVADKLPRSLDADQVAAFLPQMFTRMGDYAVELRMGLIKALTLTLDGGPCMVIDGGILYLIVAGKPGEPLPEAHIQKIAAEMAKRTF
jgi:predicted regulator of Ras-like GTPase activity (Roadblock/LC7/MglB family)